MTDDMRAAWIEACTEAILDCMERANAKSGTFRGTFPREQYRSGIAPYATAALSVLTPLIAEACAEIADEIEEDAKRGAFELYGPGSPGFARRMDKAQAARDISAAIRKWKSPPPTPGEG